MPAGGRPRAGCQDRDGGTLTPGSASVQGLGPSSLPSRARPPGAAELLWLGLGGTGEIGMNLNLYGHDGAWLMVDCGMLVDDTRPDTLLLPDPAFIAARREDLLALLLTHAHQDHLGAVAWLWPRLRCPVYATPFTAAVLRQQLAKLPPGVVEDMPLHVVRPGVRHELGPFAVEWVTLTHSIPEPCALLLQTPAGRVFHTGDWKLDETPVAGAHYDTARLDAVAAGGVAAMVCDSTSALVEGEAGSEASLLAPLTESVRAAGDGRVVATCFSSNIGRLLILAQVARRTGRRLALLGRALEQMVACARATGWWDEAVTPVPAAHVGYLPREEVLAVATGSQGEPRAALARLAAGRHPLLELDAGDTVVFASRCIPGNEAPVQRLQSALLGRGVRVVVDGRLGANDLAGCEPARTHVSGHPARAELARLYRWLRPHLLLPTHGEPPQLEANARLARECGVPVTLSPRNGDVCRLAPAPAGIVARVPVGRLRVRREDMERLLPGADPLATAAPG